MPEATIPLVSVCIQTYQHAGYIRQCLDSVLAQETRFPFEIILGEDDSTDGTRDICLAYQQEYPDRIRLFLRDEKDKLFIEGRKTGRYNLISNLKAARGTYIALLDGDDYWSHPGKLQAQAEILESNPAWAICFTGVSNLKNDKLSYYRATKGYAADYTINDLAANCFIQTCAVMFRNPGFDNLPSVYYETPVLDYCLYLDLAKSGTIRHLRTPMAVYRHHTGGLWTGSRKEEQLLLIAKFLDLMIPRFQGKTRTILQQQQLQKIKALMRLYIKQGDKKKLKDLIDSIKNKQEQIGFDNMPGYLLANRIRYGIKGIFVTPKTQPG